MVLIDEPILTNLNILLRRQSHGIHQQISRIN